MKTTSVFENFERVQIAQGCYNNPGEVIHEGVQILEESESCTLELRNAIEEGIESGRAEGFNPKQHIQSLKAKPL